MNDDIDWQEGWESGRPDYIPMLDNPVHVFPSPEMHCLYQQCREWRFVRRNPYDINGMRVPAFSIMCDLRHDQLPLQLTLWRDNTVSIYLRRTLPTGVRGFNQRRNLRCLTKDDRGFFLPGEALDYMSALILSEEPIYGYR